MSTYAIKYEQKHDGTDVEGSGVGKVHADTELDSSRNVGRQTHYEKIARLLRYKRPQAAYGIDQKLGSKT